MVCFSLMRGTRRGHPIRTSSSREAYDKGDPFQTLRSGKLGRLWASLGKCLNALYIPAQSLIRFCATPLPKVGSRFVQHVAESRIRFCATSDIALTHVAPKIRPQSGMPPNMHATQPSDLSVTHNHMNTLSE